MQRDYLFRRPGSANWWVRFVYPPELHERWGKELRLSLKTANRAEADVRAQPLIQEHKMRLWEHQNFKARRINSVRYRYLYEPGESTLDDGTRVIATEGKVIFINEGKVVDEKFNIPCPIPNFRFDPATFGTEERRRPRVPAKDDDSEMVETWISENHIAPRIADEARKVLATFKEITGDKRFADSTRDDGKALAKHFFDSGLKSATVAKKLSFMNTACGIAIEHGKLTLNPFTKALGRRKDKIKDATVRLPLDEDDMALVRSRFDELGPEEKLLWVLCANTGMRRGECFQICEEFNELGNRYVIIGSKNDQSQRRCPLPDAALPYLPKRIRRRMFTGLEKNVGRNLNRFLRTVGITDPRKVLHSTRHRAKDRLRAIGCPLDIQYQLLGHEEVTVAAGYGRGHPVAILKMWMERIGW